MCSAADYDLTVLCDRALLKAEIRDAHAVFLPAETYQLPVYQRRREEYRRQQLWHNGSKKLKSVAAPVDASSELKDLQRRQPGH